MILFQNRLIYHSKIHSDDLNTELPEYFDDKGELVENDEQILTLADSEISQLWAGERGLWHFSPSGAGFQIDGNGGAWVWRVDEGGIAHDFTLDASGAYGLIATNDGLVVGYEGDLDAEEWAFYDSEGPMVSVASDTNGWWALEQGAASFKLHSFSRNFEQHTAFNLTLSMPSTVLSTQLIFDEYLFEILSKYKQILSLSIIV